MRTKKNGEIFHVSFCHFQLCEFFLGGTAAMDFHLVSFLFGGKGRIVKPTGFQTPWGWRYLDIKNIPKTPSQEVFGRLGKGICFYLFWMLYFSSEFQNKTPSSTFTDPTRTQGAPSFKTHLPYFGQQASGLLIELSEQKRFPTNTALPNLVTIPNLPSEGKLGTPAKGSSQPSSTFSWVSVLPGVMICCGYVVDDFGEESTKTTVEKWDF